MIRIILFLLLSGPLFAFSQKDSLCKVKYYPNGKKYLEVYCIKEGLYRIVAYDTAGNVMATGKKIGTYAGDNIGKWVYYYPNGKIKKTGTYKFLKQFAREPGSIPSASHAGCYPNGKWTYYHDNGKKKYVAYFKNGWGYKLITYDINGKKISVEKKKKDEQFRDFPNEMRLKY